MSCRQRHCQHKPRPEITTAAEVERSHCAALGTLTRQAERLQAKLETVDHDEAVGGVHFTSLLRVALKVTRGLSQPQLPDLSDVNWGEGRKEGMRDRVELGRLSSKCI